MKQKQLISLFDFTGNWSQPYVDAGWDVIRVDIKNGIDLFNWNYEQHAPYGLLIASPCTDYAVSGAKHFARKDADGTTEKSQLLVEMVKRIKDFYVSKGLNFWSLENPKTRIHKLNPWIGQRPKFVFNPCDFAQLDPENSRYNKETWLFGKFNDPEKCRLEPLQKDYPGFTSLGGSSDKTKELRSITPLGFAKAFYNANK